MAFERQTLAQAAFESFGAVPAVTVGWRSAAASAPAVVNIRALVRRETLAWSTVCRLAARFRLGCKRGLQGWFGG